MQNIYYLLSIKYQMKKLFIKKKEKKAMSASALSQMSTDRKMSLPEPIANEVGHSRQPSTGSRPPSTTFPNGNTVSQPRRSSLVGSNPDSSSRNSGVFDYNLGEVSGPLGMYLGGNGVGRPRTSASLSGMSDHGSSRGACPSGSEDLDISSESLQQAFTEIQLDDSNSNILSFQNNSSLLRKSTVKQGSRPRSSPLLENQENFNQPDGLTSPVTAYRPALGLAHGLAHGAAAQYVVQANKRTLISTSVESNYTELTSPCQQDFPATPLSGKSPKTKIPHVTVTKQMKNSAQAIEDLMKTFQEQIPAISDKVCSTAESIKAVSVQDPGNEGNLPDTLIAIQQSANSFQQSAHSFQRLVCNDDLQQTIEKTKQTIAKAHDFMVLLYHLVAIGGLAVVFFITLKILQELSRVVSDIASNDHKFYILLLATPLMAIYVMIIYAAVMLFRKLCRDIE